MNKNILVVEDEDSVKRGISFALEKEGYHVFSCERICEAERIFQNESLQLVICDINLPDGNGLDWIKRVRKRSNVHIICLTALDQETDQVLGYEAGADDYITKPFSLSVLGLKVQAFFKKQVQKKETWLESGEIRFSKEEMKVYRKGEAISLTKNEWKLLWLFLEHPKQILSKKQLLEQLFDLHGVFVESNTVAVNICRLREKIEDDVKNPQYIKNVRGIGYVWDKECVEK
mgnify:FL=1